MKWLLLLGVFFSILLAFSEHARAQTGPLSYFVDCTAGNDANNGTSTGTAWKTLTKANAANLRPGDSLLFKRECTWNGRLTAKWNGPASSPITISAYGTGNLPIIQSDPSLSSSRVEVSGN